MFEAFNYIIYQFKSIKLPYIYYTQLIMSTMTYICSKDIKIKKDIMKVIGLLTLAQISNKIYNKYLYNKCNIISYPSCYINSLIEFCSMKCYMSNMINFKTVSTGFTSLNSAIILYYNAYEYIYFQAFIFSGVCNSVLILCMPILKSYIINITELLEKKIPNNEYITEESINIIAPIYCGNLSSGLDDCAICYDKTNNLYRKLPCDHVFHGPCIDEWLKRSTPKCPICRKDIRELINTTNTNIIN